MATRDTGTSTDDPDSRLTEVGYRRTILLVAVLWGTVPAFNGLVAGQLSLSDSASLAGLTILYTASLAALFELDNRRLASYGATVPRAWTYALVAPVSLVVAHVTVPALAVLLGLVGPPSSALLYLWRRGQVATELSQ